MLMFVCVSERDVFMYNSNYSLSSLLIRHQINNPVHVILQNRIVASPNFTVSDKKIVKTDASTNFNVRGKKNVKIERPVQISMLEA